MRKVLYDRNSECLQDLRSLVEKYSHRTIVLWALDCGSYFCDLFEKDVPDDKRPLIALEKGRLWAEGVIKMPEARRAILDCHQAASEHEDNPVIRSAARAVGHAAASVHAETHALGLAFYGLTAIYYLYDETLREAEIDKTIKWLTERLQYWGTVDTSKYQWAKFLQRNPEHNKEYLLRKKYEAKKG